MNGGLQVCMVIICPYVERRSASNDHRRFRAASCEFGTREGGAIIGRREEILKRRFEFTQKTVLERKSHNSRIIETGTEVAL